MMQLTECDNPTSIGHNYIGSVSDFSYNGKNFTFSNMYSSTVNSIERIENILVVQTRNTKYTFIDTER